MFPNVWFQENLRRQDAEIEDERPNPLKIFLCGRVAAKNGYGFLKDFTIIRFFLTSQGVHLA